MLPEALFFIVAAGVAGIAYARSKRSALYAGLSERIGIIGETSRIELGEMPNLPLPSFDDRLARLENVLPATALSQLRQQTSELLRPERSFIPTHKKGGTIAYETLFEAAPAVVALYHSKEMQRLVSRIVGIDVQPTPINDQSSLSVLFYDKPGDHIGWHFDHNFYRGRHFTVLLPIVNEGHGPNGLSHAMLQAKISGRETDIPTPPNTLVVFEGARVDHKVTPIAEGERRLVVSMTYCSDPRANIAQGIVRRIKDVAFFGPRALWT
jgi:hypothetical protein